MTRDQLIGETKRLIAEGERLQANPSLPALRTWLQLSDELLARAWGTMDRITSRGSRSASRRRSSEGA
jgi:hypothetical protein